MGDKPQQGSLTTNQKVVKWVHGKLKNKVGRGECWDLAENALRQADAQPSNDLGPVGPDTDYIWGGHKKIKDGIPGDILHYRNQKTTTTTQTKYTFPDGSYETVTETSKAQRNHHTVIVNREINTNGAVNSGAPGTDRAN